ncbi:hypothetical protein A2697_01250 [Candidatus Curtissbacteria bacterium RIFCSPHIGHO2_01_FULL_41_44]|uniref:Uncharacterized protein n=1 Tax=Candidatus Curtissbacteria bacterium RIFCSPLOWO2_01_FULL_42_50 TaxID=1797730 RepID=A0A1F5H398_9BACT|nr:MAG: hypothetical protein A3C33_00465 [Candidatus Curtissbacteria bacterium RIFCSPHIGHO2_02_FULL_42_58]OGD94535.1 MAG: hypothetical protein A2697_01250 [Candidatus Curtissbacteria bacterium RIFCSPHIGHO2_01_FULL_41_44]OGD97920.1 MAG: hypothetical protein A3E71_03725 [Candidatus Curtissbacteria bacterium RIFCSPHIGHO2_12_FULL_42_33]OGD98568.1 MAG: hypothetical protein A3B54_05295 [Candidatus Curtissbacteria bacterium RIFCSPLOWO2_01_FULL_42_50]OGE02144.1 MAG: hypothetical protein A3G16_02150 [Ca
MINQETGEAEIDGRKIKTPGRINFRFLVFLGQNAKKDISTDEIQEFAQKVNSLSTSGGIVARIRRLIEEDPKNPQILKTVGFKKIGAGNIANYRLDCDVEFIGEKLEEAAKEEEKLKGPPAVFESRLEALHAFVENPEVLIDEIIQILGPSREGQLLTRPRALFSLKKAASFIAERIKNGISTEAERKVWEKIKIGIGRDNDKEAFATFIAGLDA